MLGQRSGLDVAGGPDLGFAVVVGGEPVLLARSGVGHSVVVVGLPSFGGLLGLRVLRWVLGFLEVLGFWGPGSG